MPGSRGFLLRLIELVAVACHQIAAYLYDLSRQGANHTDEYPSWRAKELALKEAGDKKFKFSHLEPVVPFYHNAYCYDDQYPRGLSDVVGYWAEARIFGGVVVFDRGESDDEVTSKTWIPFRPCC